MSRIGKKPVPIPAGVTASMEAGTLSVKGPKGELKMPMSDLISYEMQDDGLMVKPANGSKAARAFWGMQRTLVLGSLMMRLSASRYFIASKYFAGFSPLAAIDRAISFTARASAVAALIMACDCPSARDSNS